MYRPNSTLAAACLGWLAEQTAPHVPAAWEVLSEHETLAWWAVGFFTALSSARFLGWLKGRGFAAAWLLCYGVLAAAAWHGGELVFRFGMGVVK